MTNPTKIRKASVAQIDAFIAEHTETLPHKCPADPLVSVCVVTYNHEKYVAQAIDSVLMQQTDFPIELFIGEDCSTDRTRDIVVKYQERFPDKIRVFLSTQNLGRYTSSGRLNFTRNLKACRGKYIALLDGDDFWGDPLKLQKQIEFLETHPEYVLCFHDRRMVDETGKCLQQSIPDSFKRDRTSEEIMRSTWIPSLTVCFRNVIDNLPPEFFKILNGDSFLFSMLGQRGHGKYLSHIKPASYRKHAGGIWSLQSTWKNKLAWFNTAYWFARYYARIGQPKYADFYMAAHRKLMRELISISLESSTGRRLAIIWWEVLSRRENRREVRVLCSLAALTIKMLTKAYCLNKDISQSLLGS
jgi:glycosyltransferase involved in cell wall biosynthesis